MTAAPIYHICLDTQGVAYVAGTSIKVADIVVDATTWGLTPPQIRENYPNLSMSQIYAALAYYHDHQAEIDAQLAAWDAENERLRAENPNPLSREQFEARRRRTPPAETP
jgi:uncharacterized protein (DUF433 family)